MRFHRRGGEVGPGDHVDVADAQPALAERIEQALAACAEREHAQQQQRRCLRVRRFMACDDGRAPPEPGQPEAGGRDQLPRRERGHPARHPRQALEGEAHRLHHGEQQPHRLQRQRLVAAAARDVAAAEPLQHLPAEHAGDGCAGEHHAPEGLQAVEAEQIAHRDHRAQRRLVLSAQVDGDQRAGERDHHEGQHQRPDRADAAVQEGEQQRGGGQVGDRPEARDVERGQARVAHQAPAGEREQHQQVGHAHRQALAGRGRHHQADGERRGPRVARQQPQEPDQHEAAFVPAEAHPGAGEHQGVDEAGGDVDEARGAQRPLHGGAQGMGGGEPRVANDLELQRPGRRTSGRGHRSGCGRGRFAVGGGCRAPGSAFTDAPRECLGRLAFRGAGARHRAQHRAPVEREQREADRQRQHRGDQDQRRQRAGGDEDCRIAFLHRRALLWVPTLTGPGRHPV